MFVCFYEMLLIFFVGLSFLVLEGFCLKMFFSKVFVLKSLLFFLQCLKWFLSV